MRFLILFLANLLLVVNGDILLKLKKIKKREAQNSVQPCGVTQVTSGCPYSSKFTNRSNKYDLIKDYF